MADQSQRGGVGSTNIQIGTVANGLSYADVRDIASDLFASNFANLMDAARETAAARAEEIRDQIVEKLKNSPNGDPNSFNQVEKQVSLLEAQKAYAISGDEDLRDLLVKTVVDISSAKERSLKSITLNEAIKVSASLTPSQMRALGFAFAVIHVNFPTSSLGDLFEKYGRAIALSSGNVDLTDVDLRHLEYLGCGSVGITSASLFSILKTNYPGLISSRFRKDELTARFAPDDVPKGVFRECVDDNDKLEFAVATERRLRDDPLYRRQIDITKAVFKERPIDEAAFEAQVKSLGSGPAYLFERWTTSGLAALNLTTVGMAVGHAYMSSKLPVVDLDVWM